MYYMIDNINKIIVIYSTTYVNYPIKHYVRELSL